MVGKKTMVVPKLPKGGGLESGSDKNRFDADERKIAGGRIISRKKDAKPNAPWGGNERRIFPQLVAVPQPWDLGQPPWGVGSSSLQPW